jgi:hypothetical protein
MYENGRINEYGCAMNLKHVATDGRLKRVATDYKLKHVATDYKHQVFNYNNKNSHKRYLQKLCSNICMANWFWNIMSNKYGLQDSDKQFPVKEYVHSK